MGVEKTNKRNFAMMSGALKNAGDFLIVKRCEELVRHVYPDAELTFYNRLQPLTEHLWDINNSDAMIFCGGPAYLPQLYPQCFPLLPDLNSIKVPMFALGLGWFGSSDANKAVYNYRFTDTTLQLLQRIEQDTKVLGCRDWHSVNVLRNNGIWSGKMTGCPAWYNLTYIGAEKIRTANPYEIKKICISDPARVENLEQLLDVAAYIRQIFPKAELKVVFHRGITEDAYTSQGIAEHIKKALRECEAMGAECVDISYGEEGFAVYDDCDLQIGFRVHAHIYNLSCRNISMLIEEDGRGAGVNHALGLEHIRAYDYGVKAAYQDERVISTVGTVRNKYLLNQIDDCINNLFQNNFMQMHNTYHWMNHYYGVMEQHVSDLRKYI